MKRNKKLIITSLIFCIFILFSSLLMEEAIKDKKNNELTYNEFLQMVKEDKVKEITLNYGKGNFTFTDKKDKKYIAPNPRYEDFKKDMLKKNIEVKEVSSLDFSGVIVLVVYGAFIYMMYKMMKSQGLQEDVEIKKSPKTENTITFDKVAGLTEVKKDMITFVDFLKNKKNYTKMGAKLPRGVILYGPPGTGKTLLAKAIAEEADVPFFCMSGSDFIELFVGMGAKRVRELFKKAKASAPCIIFIDEIDAIGGKRSHISGSSEDRKTINALLTELDGFKDSENILVIGATNRIEDLDPALLRPGRFTEKFCVPLPETTEERMESIKLYSKDKKFSEDVDFENFSKETIGCSPADIEAILNEAAIIAVQKDKGFIDKKILEEAMFKKLISGHAKRNHVEDKELKLIAYHEAGHALVGKLLDLDVTKVTIIGSTTGAGGVTLTVPKKMGLYTKKELLNEIKQLYAGRCAEYLLVQDWDEITTGASNDIQKASNLISALISDYGMTDSFDMLSLEEFKDNKEILIEAKKIAKSLKEETLHLLEDNYKTLKTIADSLLLKETLYEKDLDNIIKNSF